MEVANTLGWTLLGVEVIGICCIIAFFVGRARARREWAAIEDPIEEIPIPQPQPQPRPVEPLPPPPPPEQYTAPSREPKALHLAGGVTLHREMSGDKVVYVGTDGDVYEPIMGIDS